MSLFAGANEVTPQVACQVTGATPVETVGAPVETPVEARKTPVEMDKAPVQTEETPVETPVKTSDKIVQALRANPSMTLAEVAQEIGKSRRAVERATAKLAREGRLRYVGPRKSGTWEVLK